MGKYVKIAGVVLVVLISFAGCDWLFGPNVDSVEPEDLVAFTASQTIASDETAVQNAVFEAVGGTDGSGGLGCAIAYLISSEEFTTKFNDAFLSVGGEFSVSSFMQNIVQSNISRARSIAIDGNFDEDPSDDILGADITILIENETVNGSDIDPAGTGTATVQRFFVSAEGSEEVLAWDSANFPESIEVEGSFEHDASVSYDGFSCDGEIIIHAGQINSEGSGRGEVTMDSDALSVFWRFGYGFSAGVSFSNTLTDEGGKLILEFGYSGRANLDFNVNDNIDQISTLVTGEVEVTLSVRLYDNADQLVVEYTYTDEDLFDEYQALMI